MKPPGSFGGRGGSGWAAPSRRRGQFSPRLSVIGHRVGRTRVSTADPGVCASPPKVTFSPGECVKQPGVARTASFSSTDLMKQRVGTLISGSFILTGHRPKPGYHLRLTGTDAGHRVRIKGAVLTRSRVSFPPGGVVVVLYCVIVSL